MERKIDEEKIKEYILKNPDIKAYPISVKFKITIDEAKYYMRKYTHKKGKTKFTENTPYLVRMWHANGDSLKKISIALECTEEEIEEFLEPIYDEQVRRSILNLTTKEPYTRHKIKKII